MVGDQSAKDGERKVSIESRIRTALVPLGYKTYPATYDGADETYFVFNYTIIPDDYADDEANHERYLVQLHLFAPHTLNTVTTRKSIRNLIQAAFMRPSEMPAHDELKQHYVYEFEAEYGTG